MTYITGGQDGTQEPGPAWAAWRPTVAGLRTWGYCGLGGGGESGGCRCAPPTAPKCGPGPRGPSRPGLPQPQR